MCPRKFCLAIAVCLSACGVSKEVVIATLPPFANCRINTYGWSRATGLAQEIWIELLPGSNLGQAIDLSQFAGLQPGMTDKDSRARLGSPTSTQVDRWGETWLLYDRRTVKLKIGCSYDGFGPEPEGCLWRLFALVDRDHEAQVLNRELRRLMEAGRSVHETIQSQTTHVHTSDKRAFVSLSRAPNGQLSILWHDDSKRSWRSGRPRARNVR